MDVLRHLFNILHDLDRIFEGICIDRLHNIGFILHFSRIFFIRTDEIHLIGLVDIADLDLLAGDELSLYLKGLTDFPEPILKLHCLTHLSLRRSAAVRQRDQGCACAASSNSVT